MESNNYLMRSLSVLEYEIASQIFMSLSECGCSVNMSKWISPLKTDFMSLPITRITEV